ncbi:uncharacterized protein B0H64DRAFT_443553 [Chaetomium fimeti]|jgi:hypothetical protein|uniref:Uncharacterized protein n=1 Tax=Chaetomium fimeti TaxID=1854472 RepID=A0AAE0HD97_9PEZI|nr:hypothetical protein B0H64DRAFT_443553 [Chaetomium fimeti]
MQLSLSNSLVFLGLLGISSAAPAGQDIDPVTLPGELPPTCIGHKCFTATTTKTVSPTICPLALCVPPTSPIACPAIIHITTTKVPCSTDCCPTTPTATVVATGDCPGCTASCVIPTSTSTVTTGCKTTPDVVRPTGV